MVGMTNFRCSEERDYFAKPCLPSDSIIEAQPHLDYSYDLFHVRHCHDRA